MENIFILSCVANLLLYLAFLPTCGRITELGFKHEVAYHDLEACINNTLLATANLINGSLHVIVNTAFGHTAQYPEALLKTLAWVNVPTPFRSL
jgi:hypothetical protein